MIRIERAQAIGLLMAATGAIAFSGKAIVAKLMYALGADALSTVGLRMAFALPLFGVMAWWSRRGASAPTAVTPAQWGQVAVLGFLGYYLASTLDFMGLQYISASLERAILYLNPTIVLLMSAVWLKQRVRAGQWVAVALAYLGVAVVWLHDWQAIAWTAQGVQGLSPTAAVAWGSFLVLCSAISYAAYLLGSGRLLPVVGASWLVAHASLVACVLCLGQWGLQVVWSPEAAARVATLGWQAYALSAFNALACTVLPIWLVMMGVQRLGPALAAQVGMVGPVSTIWMAAWWLHEPVTWTLVLGTAAILGGVVLLSVTSPARR